MALESLGEMTPARGWLELAELILEHSDELGGARAACDRALERDPELTDALVLRADLHGALGQTRAELQDRVTLGDLRPMGPEAADSLARAARLAHEKLGDTGKAVDAYVVSVAAEPTPDRLARLMATARAAGRSEADTNAAVWAIRDKRAKPSTAFTLKSLDGKDVSLADFRGKAVLLNFWFPG